MTFNLGYGDWVRVLHASGFAVEELIEIQAPEDAATDSPIVTPAWAQPWPSEEIWMVRKR